MNATLISLNLSYSQTFSGLSRVMYLVYSLHMCSSTYLMDVIFMYLLYLGAMSGHIDVPILQLNLLANLFIVMCLLLGCIYLFY